MNSSISVFDGTKIYIACHPNIATGGPELLHQLAYHLINDLKVEAFMYYYNFDHSEHKTPLHPEYEFYNIPYVLDIGLNENHKKNILIVPEILSAVKLLEKHNDIRKCCWFLSVDNYYLSKITKTDFFFARAINKLSKKLFGVPVINFDITSKKSLDKLIEKHDYRKDNLLKLADFYMTNSHRGVKFFRDLKPLFYLSEYINDDFLAFEKEFSEKENIVAFNPGKGFIFTKKIISCGKNIKFVPLMNMTRKQVIETLRKAKVYMDFGNHPGKDRLPREAAILGCCVITGKRGSAAFDEDVPIPKNYKFEDEEENIKKIIYQIEDFFENFAERNKDFNRYVEKIKNEKKIFLDDLEKIFIKI